MINEKRDQWDEIAERLLPCDGNCGLGFQHYADCPAYRRPAVAAELRKLHASAVDLAALVQRQGGRIAELEGVLRWYADSGCKGENMIVNRDSGVLVSDMYDWGSKARAALENAAELRKQGDRIAELEGVLRAVQIYLQTGKWTMPDGVDNTLRAVLGK